MSRYIDADALGIGKANRDVFATLAIKRNDAELLELCK